MKKVLITVNTTQSYNEESDTIELVTEGIMNFENNEYNLEYDETEISGMGGTTTNIKISDDSVELIRKGTTNSHLKFKKGYTHLSLYGIEEGAFEIAVKTNSIKIDINELGGRVDLDYKIETQGVEISRNVLVLTVKPIN